MKNMWLRHKAGIKHLPTNVYMVELPPPTAEEPTDTRCETKKKGRSKDESI